MQCPTCHREVSDGTNYCRFCGTKLTPRQEPNEARAERIYGGDECIAQFRNKYFFLSNFPRVKLSMKERPIPRLSMPSRLPKLST